MFPLHDSIRITKTPIFTWAFIVINVWVFFLELSRGEAFIHEYALIPARIDLLEASTLSPFLSSLFLHGGWFHLLANMWFLYIFGDNVENALGKVKFLGFYLATGLAAGLTQYVFAPESAIPIVGASGAIAGILGAYLVFFPHAKITSLVPILFFITVLDVPATLYLPYWFLLQLFSGVGQIASGALSTTGGVAFLAHAGGFVAGYVIARWVRR